MLNRRNARLLLALILAGNGIAMLAMPQAWYSMMPGVAHTGPLNPHFVRDVGAAYLIAGGAFAWLRSRPEAWPAALTGGAFLSLHALIHVGEMFAGSIDPHHLLRDLPGVFLIPVFALWLAWPGRRIRNIHSHKEIYHAQVDRTGPTRQV
ncbi:MAG TPA: hypothetical protein VEC06_13920 [Paucimonas sp.]|nr:hypothetical protein [Paucimonas sp.]